MENVLSFKPPKREHYFGKIAEADLKKVFDLLKTRCPDTWNFAYEQRAIELHNFFMILRNFKTVELIDPEAESNKEEHESNEATSNNKPTAEQLMKKPKLWKMEDKKNGEEFLEILRHFTIFTPFEGRPFVRAWLEALLPCLCRWVLLSADIDNVNDMAVNQEKTKDAPLVQTLKHFLGAFGQPGIVCCIADKGEQMLETLQNSARAVEARGRGDVEGYYWKRITESTLGGKNNWAELATLEDIDLELSQLDHLPRG